MRQLGAISSLVFCLTMFVACVNEASHPNSEQADKLRQAQFAHQLSTDGDTAYYSIQVDYKLGDGSDDYKKKDITKIVLSYPFIDSFSNKTIKDSINTTIRNILLQDVVGEIAYQSLEERMNEFVVDYKVYKKEMKEFGLPVSANWFYELTIDVLLNSPTLMSLRMHKLEFTGGAHANPWTNYLNLDLKTGKELTLNDLLTGDYQSQLLAVAESQFKESTNLAPDTNLLETNYEFSTGNFMLPENFSIGKNGLSFHYNPYDLGPFALGVISFEIPYKEILNMINKDLLVLEMVAVEK